MKAFTLVEMLLVLVLLSVATAVSLPNLSKSYAKIQLQNEANNLTYNLRYAQSRAITQNKNIRILFNDTFTRYQILEDSSTSVKEEYKPITGQWGRTNRLSENFILKGSKPSIDFSPNGEIEKINLLLCIAKDCLIISTQEQRGQIEVLDAN